ncbi:hypothetical protein SAMN02746065_113122 [Desulfocicer vacuolatum DSM 3385]|uniref:DUF3303 domain-containing protein n=1 Tax=Desulfocicer vacuolatum DSM 3385 TaxID=1121400 RepID=A0A1W2CU85_9BACT|nr:hypothetical protein [Desulfocicer vacuolatum]SMC88810.1 hypothetical protein SAMN02746065_113122 [Desulfocicer vacuolatum DSM 3385]
MIFMHCKVRFTDYSRWKASMDADAQAQSEAGLHLKHLWRGVEDPNMAFFVLEVEDVHRARAFLEPKNVEKAETAAGASDFEWHFVENIAVPSERKNS